ncbi:uncharacterized protein LOC142979065 [Anticarsia gemmatalis]|uniref:uncharacterized protein LOC142979065 n=1 Tax=Anticarsia gemmatalis TaxID=129554 RepID=UPI003F77810D
MYLKCILLVVVCALSAVSSEDGSNSVVNGSCPNLKTSLGSVRKRRHLAFPTGSGVSLAVSAVKTFMTHVPAGWYFVIEAEMVYHLPDAEFIAAHTRRKLKHRQKREMWELLQTALDERNLNGRACIIRTICEARVNLAPKGQSLVHDLLRTIFTIHPDEEEFIQEMGVSYDEILAEDLCEKTNDCPFSFLRFILDLNKER